MSTPRFTVVIPVRYASVRLPAKPLLDIGGKPMIVRVYEAARRSRAADVVVATDDERIASACRAAGAPVEMTAAHHASGTDRIAELVQRRGFDDDAIVVNVQGDEPLLPPRLVDQVAELLASRAEADLATLVADVRDERSFRDPNVVKVVCDEAGYALYFSRAPIPFPRDAGVPADVRRHVGLYAYRAASLRTLAAAPPCGIERAERLEQLRALWIGLRIAVADAVEVPPRGVDTEEDLTEVRRIVERQ